MSTKYIFLDIDGTLVGYDSKIPDSALNALNMAQKNGHKVFIASGRSLPIIYPDLLKAVNFDGIVASGGACVFYNGEAIFRSVIEGDALNTIVDYFKREGIHFIAHTSEAVYGEQDFFDVVIPGMVAAGCNKELVEKSFSGVIPVEDIKKVKNVEKLSYYLSPYSTQKISDDNGGRFYVVDFNIGNVSQDFSFGEMNLSGVNKGTAIERFMEHIGAPISNSIAFGDSGNDLEMMHCAGISVAMGNATNTIKEVADYVTSDVDKDGIYNAFVHLGLI